MLVVSDASPIRALEWTGLVHILGSLYGKVVIPPAVALELLCSEGAYPRIDLARIGFIEINAPQNQKLVDRLKRSLDPGESEAIALALEAPACLLLMDEKAGRQQAGKLDLNVIGTVGVLVQAKQVGLIPTIGPILERLRRELRFFLSERVMAEALRLAGEEPA